MFDVNAEIKKILDAYPDLWKKKSLKKDTIFHSAGGFANENYYLETGMMKIFVVNNDISEESIVAFVKDGTALLPYKGNHTQTPKMFNIQTITDAVMHSISKDNWEIIRKEKQILDEIIHYDSIRVSNIMGELALIKSISDAKKRYEKALQKHPFLNQIKYEDVASYLGITTRTLINITTNQIKKNKISIKIV